MGEDFEAAVAALLARSVRLERYPDPEQDTDGVARFGDFRMAWFKDPDGNTLHVNSG